MRGRQRASSAPPGCGRSSSTSSTPRESISSPRYSHTGSKSREQTMLWISAILFVGILAVLLSLYFLIAPGWTERKEIKKRLSLLELRNLEYADLPDVLKSEPLSDVPALNRILPNLNVAVQIDSALKQANMEMKVGTFILLAFFLFALDLLL